MRECINTPCRGSDLGASDLITVVRQELDSPIRRSGLRSSRRSKAVTFEDVHYSPTKSARRKRRGSRALTSSGIVQSSPRRPLAQKETNENARPPPPSTADEVTVPQKRKLQQVVGLARQGVESEISTQDSITQREDVLIARVETLELDLEEREAKVDRLTSLVKFLSAEVRIYTQCLEEQVERQGLEIASLKRRLQDASP